MHWLHQLRIHLLPITSARAQKRVDDIDHALAKLRTEIALLPPVARSARAQDVQALIAAQAHARDVLADTLDDRIER